MLLNRSFHSPNKVIAGDAPLVGVLDLPSQGIHRPPIRLFFPATVSADSERNAPPKKASYFVNNRVSYVLEGFAHIAIARHSTKYYRFCIRPLMWLISCVFPARYLKIPETALVTPKSQVKYWRPLSSQKELHNRQTNQSLVIFSHGLTGTGEENSIFCTSLAKRGYVVASIHHRDGSSCRVPMPDGTCKYYEHFPSGKEYDPKHRLEQVHVRAKEMLDTCEWLLNEKFCPEEFSIHGHDGYHILKDISANLNKKNVIAAGFSYGAATCALASTLKPEQFQCAVLLDGWFHIEWSSKNVDIDFPPEAFSESSIGPGSRGLTIPSLFINSSQFQGYTKLYGATCRLAEQIDAQDKSPNLEKRTEMYVLPNTQHQNFCDIVFWIPKWALRRGGKLFAIGNADSQEVYQNIMDWTFQFLKKHC